MITQILSVKRRLFEATLLRVLRDYLVYRVQFFRDSSLSNAFSMFSTLSLADRLELKT